MRKYYILFDNFFPLFSRKVINFGLGLMKDGFFYSPLTINFDLFHALNKT